MSSLRVVQPVKHDLDVIQLADMFVQSGWAGKGVTHAQVMVKLLWGAEMGLGPVASVQGIDVIQGRPAPSGGLIFAQVDAHPRYAYGVLNSNSSVCRLGWYVGADLAYASPWSPDRNRRWIEECGAKAGEPCPPAPADYGLAAGVTCRGTNEFSVADADAAGLLGKQVWRQYPKAMLFNRAVTAGQRVHAPNLWGGLKNYTPEELGEDEVVEVEVAEVTKPKPQNGNTPSMFAEAVVVEEGDLF